ncbi:PA3496 family putative envelope integrity protein [Neptunomonas concharum]|jgi:hypothetical protein|uniref:PA3496 family putative envelope integrity protein n=1 Tax=Neptunomonas concharum TaxID=1031538 RepID=UPI001FE79C85|nr:hypothetical protein [Neptunomonas concharum]
MLNQKTATLSHVQIEVIDTLIGFEEEEKIRNKQQASKRLLAARRAIEAHREEVRLSKEIDREAWFDDI